jgi:dephospho-CoA kinase
MTESVKRRPGPLLLGITGNIACGKSAVGRVLAGFGADVIDADLVYRDLVQPGLPLLDAIRSRFGQAVVDPDGMLDRRALAVVVFSDPAALAALDDLVRPVVGPEMLNRAAASHARVVVLDAVKLFESGLAASCDETWAIVCRLETQVDRLMERNGVSREEARRRIAAQRPQCDKAALADVVIGNDGSLGELADRVQAAYEAFLARHERPPDTGPSA